MSGESFYDKETRPWLSDRLNTATIVGHTTTSSVRLWFRVFAPGDYELVIRENDPIDTKIIAVGTRGRQRVVVSRANPRAAPSPQYQLFRMTFRKSKDLTGVQEIRNLKPGTTYYYALRRAEVKNAFSWEWELGYEDQLSFKTFSPDRDQATTFGLFSCHMPFEDTIKEPLPVNGEMWIHFHEELRDANAAYVIGAGDQVYADGHEGVDIWRWLRKVKDKRISKEDARSWYRDIYRGYWGQKVVQRIFRSFPNYMIWDDHEIKDGWGSYTEAELSNELDTWFEWENRKKNLELAHLMFEAAQDVYTEYQHSHNPDPPRKQAKDGRRNWHYHFKHGSVGTFVLDMRGHRHFKTKTNAQILGTEQFNDLASWLENDTDDCKVIFIVATVPVVHASSFILNWTDLPFLSLKDDSRDHWEHKAHLKERKKLLELVFDYSNRTKRRVVFLSGDVHIAATMELKGKPSIWPDARVYQITSSGITYAGLSSFARRILKLVVSKKGELKPNLGWYKQIEEPLKTNNFGIVRVRPDGDDVEVVCDLYGKGEEPRTISRLRRIVLK